MQGTFIQGQTLQVYAAIIIKKEFIPGSVELDVKANKISVFKHVVLLGNQQPMLYFGATVPLFINEPMPFTAQIGNYELIATLRDAAGVDLQCFNVTFTLA